MFNNYFLMSFALTIISASFWPIIPSIVWIVPIFCILCASIKYRAFSYLGGVILAVLLIIYQGNLIKTQTSALFQSGQNTIIKASVTSLFKKNTHGYKSVLVVRSIGDEKTIKPQAVKVQLFTPFKLNQGDLVTLSVLIKPIYGLLNEAGFDKERYLFSKGIVANANYIAGTSYRIRSTQSIRAVWFEEIKSYTENFSNQDLILALSFGYRELISNDTWGLLKSSGLLHLIAISGLHIGIAYGIGYKVGISLRWFLPHAVWIPLITGLSLAIFYSWFAGFTLPTQRALVMCCIASFLIFSRVKVGLVQYLLLSLCVVLIFDPFSTLSSSFWMSFGAVSVVLYCVQFFAMDKNKTGLINRWVSLLKIQCMLSFMVLPLTMLFFGGFSAATVIYNVLFLPWFTLVVIPILFLSIFITIFLNVDATLFWGLVDKSLSILELSIPYSDSYWINSSIELAATMTIIIFILFMFYRYLSKSTVFIIGCICLLGLLTRENERNSLKIDFLDVGHGLAILIEKNKQVIVYDTGKAWEGGSIVDSVVTPILQSRGVKKVEGVIISHFDSDHSGGYKAIVKNFAPEWIRTSQRATELHKPCIQGESWLWNQVSFKVLWPPKLVNRAYNPQSCVVRLEDHDSGRSLLLTGDIEALSEWLLSRNPTLLKSDVMLVPHHGSFTSSINIFIQSVEPEFAIASLAKGNQWGMPNSRVMDRYAQVGSHWLDTGSSGQISFEIVEGKWKFHTIRGDSPFPWYRQMLRKGVE
ncbi:MAG: DNA internalization-related competence protein ComEC/Rec2 [Vibrio gallaecicus]